MMKLRRWPLWLGAVVLLVFAMFDRHAIGDKVAFNIEWAAAMVLLSIANAIRDEE